MVKRTKLRGKKYHQALRNAWKQPHSQVIRGLQSHNAIQRRTRKYFEVYNATNRAIKFFNKFRQPYSTYRHKEIWPQRTVQRTVPRFSPQPTFETGRGRFIGPQGVRPPSNTPFGNKPQLSYEQENKNWTIHKPWTQSMNKPPIPQFKEAQRRLEQSRSDYLYTTIPYSHLPPEIGDLAFVNTQRPRHPPARWPKWEPLTRPLLPDRPLPPPNDPGQPDIPTSNTYKRPIPCMHWDERLQTWFPCTSLQRKTPRSRRSYDPSYSQYTFSKTRPRRQHYRKRSPAWNSRYYRRRPRPYSRFRQY